MMSQVYNPSAWKVEAGWYGSQFLPCLYRYILSSLDYMTSYLKTQNKINENQKTEQLDLRQWGPGYLPGRGIYCVIKSKLGVSGSKIFRKRCAREAQKW